MPSTACSARFTAHFHLRVWSTIRKPSHSKSDEEQLLDSRSQGVSDCDEWLGPRFESNQTRRITRSRARSRDTRGPASECTARISIAAEKLAWGHLNCLGKRHGRNLSVVQPQRRHPFVARGRAHSPRNAALLDAGHNAPYPRSLRV